jgi:small subunit ribosomal protein S8
MDPIADFLTQIKNAYLAHHLKVKTPYSKTNIAIAQVLEDNHLIKQVETSNNHPQKKQLVITLLYHQKTPAITHIKRISKPGVRIYSSKADLPRPLSGRGLAIISTSKGIVSHHQARKLGLGGEVLCEIW